MSYIASKEYWDLRECYDVIFVECDHPELMCVENIPVGCCTYCGGISCIGGLNDV